MREIKFRGMTTNLVENEFVYGYYQKIIGYGSCDMGNIYHLIVNENDESNYVDEKTVGQYTGLKDKNGVEVFEGDKVNVIYGKWYHNKEGLDRNGVVIFDKKTSSFKISIENSKVLVGFYDLNKIEVIGNIHEVKP